MNGSKNSSNNIRRRPNLVYPMNFQEFQHYASDNVLSNKSHASKGDNCIWMLYALPVEKKGLKSPPNAARQTV